MICDHRINQIESVHYKGKNVAEETTLAKPCNLDPRQGIFLGMMQIVTAKKWYVKCTIVIDNTFSITDIAMIDSGADSSNTLSLSMALSVRLLGTFTHIVLAWQKYMKTPTIRVRPGPPSTWVILRVIQRFPSAAFHKLAWIGPQVVEDHSPFKQITRKLQMKKGIISKSEAIALYMEEVKKDLMKNLDIDIKDDISMASASHTNEDDEAICLAGEGQDADSIEEIHLDAFFQKTQQHVEESSSTSAAVKGKAKE
uniref:Uncharacterized protein n=1 Tax=Solanum tuberosum TaxID=4113 RepID=M1B012_SOLTU